ncbi:hypothetical protein [Pseudomonas psychrophila]|uniref:hypothetical protein n=1 Tax=Pseudomonas psychrophila TaxID=122355 RepID=UPI0003064D17|nr:hypothetical protein [Pseudomonas psychrophila]
MVFESADVIQYGRQPAHANPMTRLMTFDMHHDLAGKKNADQGDAQVSVVHSASTVSGNQ